VWRKPVNTILVIVALAVFAATSATAQTAFYVAQDVKTKSCQVVETKPEGPTLMSVGSGNAYKTRDEAEIAMKNIRACEAPK
jgi:hypothetical protein